MSKKISMIIPVYNAEKYLENTIQSVINQTYNNIELILVDDGSSDNSSKIIDKYVEKYPEIVKGYHQKKFWCCESQKQWDFVCNR